MHHTVYLIMPVFNIIEFRDTSAFQSARPRIVFRRLSSGREDHRCKYHTANASSSKEEAQRRADAALSIFHDTQLLLSKGVSEELDSPLKRVVGMGYAHLVTFPDHFYGFAMDEDKIYGTKRRIEP
ncbi:hypothetical protein INT44_001666 [Umbelopsis vinacea]|uniref:Uncharacterized protein n=1 Tax=Umbelopsis vinacea TaxID=44442 RepID=A0A8H7PQC2_9FUNG|nr:hypothetical protein INT44_001666 [Umbelopsis vinacea]